MSQTPTGAIFMAATSPYCANAANPTVRRADKKASGKAALISLTERQGNKIAKQLQNSKTSPKEKQLRGK
jgi:hypothetical protein